MHVVEIDQIAEICSRQRRREGGGGDGFVHDQSTKTRCCLAPSSSVAMDLAALENQKRAERCECRAGQRACVWIRGGGDLMLTATGEKGVKVGEGTFANVYKGVSAVVSLSALADTGRDREGDRKEGYVGANDYGRSSHPSRHQEDQGRGDEGRPGHDGAARGQVPARAAPPQHHRRELASSSSS